MTNDTLKLTDQQVLEYARAGLQEHLTLTAEGYKCTTEDLLDVLLGVGVKGGTMRPSVPTWEEHLTQRRSVSI
jgi:hypothetical protein